MKYFYGNSEIHMESESKIWKYLKQKEETFGCEDNLCGTSVTLSIAKISDWLCSIWPFLPHWSMYVLPDDTPCIENLLSQRSSCIIMQDSPNKSQEKSGHIIIHYYIIHDYTTIVIKIVCCCYKRDTHSGIDSPKMNKKNMAFIHVYTPYNIIIP